MRSRIRPDGPNSVRICILWAAPKSSAITPSASRRLPAANTVSLLSSARTRPAAMITMQTEMLINRRTVRCPCSRYNRWLRRLESRSHRHSVQHPVRHSFTYFAQVFRAHPERYMEAVGRTQRDNAYFRTRAALDFPAGDRVDEPQTRIAVLQPQRPPHHV